MTYLEARNSGYPFNRRKYKDGWYIRDLRRDVDYDKMRDNSCKRCGEWSTGDQR